MSKGFLQWVFATFVLVAGIQAETLTGEQEKALHGVIEQLTDPNLRLDNLKKDKKAADSDEMVKRVGGEFSEEIYQLAAKVMESLVVKTQGNPEAMEKILEKAGKDPESFAKTFSADQQKLLKDLAKKIEARQKKSVP